MPATHKLKAAKEKRREKSKAVKRAREPKQLMLFRVFALIVGVVIFGALAKTLYSSWANRIWLPNTRITVVVATNDPKIYSYDPQSGKLISIVIPKNTQVDTSMGFGQWLAGSLWGLGAQEKIGGELMRLSFQKSLGIPVDAWADERGEVLFKAHALGWFSSAWEAFTLSSIKTDLTFFDRANILFHIAQTKGTERRALDLEAIGVIKKNKLSDGEAGYIIVPERTKIALDILRDTLVYTEAKKVVVENATGKNGVAGSVAQTAAVLGVRVIGAQTSDEDVTDCLIRGDEKQLESISAKRLMQIFSCEKIEKKTSGPQDLEILLGRDFKERF